MNEPLSRRVAEAVVERRGAWARSAGLAVLSLIADVEETRRARGARDHGDEAAMEGPLSRRVAEAVVERRGARVRSAG